MYSLLKLLLLGVFCLGHSVGSEDVSSRHHHALTSIKQRITELQKEVNELHGAVKSEMGQTSNVITHLEESLAQAGASAHDAAGSIHNPPSPLVGSHAKRHVIREMVGFVLQIIGTYGIFMTLGTISYYCVTGLLVSGGLFAAFISSIPLLLSWAIFFPPILIVIEMLFGLSYVMGLFSWNTLIAAFEGYGFLMMNPILLEKIGMLTLAIGCISLVFQFSKQPIIAY